MRREVRSRKMQIVWTLKSFSKYLCWHINCVASKIPSHNTFPNKNESRMAIWQRHLQARQPDSQAQTSKKKFHEGIVCRTQEQMSRLCNLLPGVFITWPDKVLHNCSGFAVSTAWTRGWIRQPLGGSFKPTAFHNSLLLHHSQTQLNSAPPSSWIRHGRESLWSCRATRHTFLDASWV